MASSVSVVIPTLNEAGNLGDMLARLRAQRPREIIVADGGSTDATRASAGRPTGSCTHRAGGRRR